MSTPNTAMRSPAPPLILSKAWALGMQLRQPSAVNHKAVGLPVGTTNVEPERVTTDTRAAGSPALVPSAPPVPIPSPMPWPDEAAAWLGAPADTWVVERVARATMRPPMATTATTPAILTHGRRQTGLPIGPAGGPPISSFTSTMIPPPLPPTPKRRHRCVLQLCKR